LQRELDVDVNMLLFCAWLGASRKAMLSAEQLEMFEDIVRAWHEDVVKPLRRVRDTVKGGAAVDEDIGALRKKVLDAELDAERIEQALLYQAALESPPEAASHASTAMLANVLLFLQSKARAANRLEPALPAALLAAAADTVR
jgi:uncharacterized protein (TIGR02444 family)